MLKDLYLRGFIIGGDFDEEYLHNIPAIKHLRQFAFQKETEHYVLTRQFLENPETMLRYLLEE